MMLSTEEKPIASHDHYGTTAWGNGENCVCQAAKERSKSNLDRLREWYQGHLAEEGFTDGPIPTLTPIDTTGLQASLATLERIRQEFAEVSE